ncbi:sigma-70 family RNA polymerase sigma factor [Haloechinothrix salitolerans]|uniref:RNA polymerase sigma factor n=1 Tax=Haloechinothrix salitolerans TaxID=926830 RepID=A0ABW2BX19_9PSEU
MVDSVARQRHPSPRQDSDAPRRAWRDDGPRMGGVRRGRRAPTRTFGVSADAYCPTYIWELVGHARSGDSGAFSVLYQTHVEHIYQYVLSRTRNRTVADDVTSETFARALRGLDSVTYRGSTFRAWLTTIARNIVLDNARSTKNRREVKLPDNVDYRAETRDPESVVCVRETEREVRKWLDELTEDQRRCVLLRFFDDLPVAEVAARMGRSRASVRSLQVRAIRKLAMVIPHELELGAR